MGSKQKSKKKSNQKGSLLVIAGLILLVVIVVISIISGRNKSSVLPESITVQQAAEKLANGAVMIDVREQSEWNDSHVEGATLIPLGEISSRISEIPTDKEVLVICRSGRRSAEAVSILRSAGLKNTMSISGGITEWIARGYPVLTGP